MNVERLGTDEIVYAYCLSLLGLPYRWGGDDTILGFDCSGLVQEILAACGADPAGDQTAQMLYNYFKNQGCAEMWAFGALAFYGSSLDRIGHVGFLLNSTTMIEAGGGGSTTKTEADAARHNAFVRIRPVKFRSDLRAVLMPKYDWSSHGI